MAKKQILISQNDFGITFNVKILDEDDNPIVIGTDNVKIYIVTPSGNKIEVTNIVIDEANSTIEFVIEKEHTQEVGNHEIYLEISSYIYEITTVLPENYYVMAEHGGA